MTYILQIRPKPRAGFEVISYNGENAAEVARWLADHGRDATVRFDGSGEMLSINGYRVDVPADDGIIYLNAAGERLTKKNIETGYEVVSRR